MEPRQVEVSVSDRQYLNVIGRLNEIERRLGEASINIPAEIDASIMLNGMVRPPRAIPSAGGWAASYQTILHIVDSVLSRTDAPQIAEFGGGTSSLWIGLALKKLGGGGQLVSFEQDEKFAARTRGLVKDLGLDEYVEVVYAPMVNLSLEDKNYVWYDSAVVRSQLRPLDIVLVDGPFSDGDPLGRFPAFQVCLPFLKQGGTLYLDDIDRTHEQSIAASWLELSEGRLTRSLDVSRTAVFRLSS